MKWNDIGMKYNNETRSARSSENKSKIIKAALRLINEKDSPGIMT